MFEVVFQLFTSDLICQPILYVCINPGNIINAFFFLCFHFPSRLKHCFSPPKTELSKPSSEVYKPANAGLVPYYVCGNQCFVQKYEKHVSPLLIHSRRKNLNSFCCITCQIHLKYYIHIIRSLILVIAWDLFFQNVSAWLRFDEQRKNVSVAPCAIFAIYISIQLAVVLPMAPPIP